MSKNYLTERDGQIEFFERFNIVDTELANYTDGVYEGTIFEFKKSISNVHSTLSQAIKYLSHMRVKGRSIPANILLVSLNQETAYLFKSKDYLEYIEEIYAGAASKNNENFSAITDPEVIRYSSKSGSEQIRKVLDDRSYIKIHVDMFCVVGWAERFYREKPRASKIQLFEELRSPTHFSAYLYPWEGDDTDFKYIMDLLNDLRHKKELGAFYTPPAYCRKATELVRKAIAQIPQGNDYIILDRCAGTGNLEEFLTDKSVSEITIGELSKYLDKDFIGQYLKDKENVISMLGDTDFNSITMGELEKYKTKININDYIFDNELSHTIVNTYELKEWIVLNENIGNRVKMIIPPPQEVKSTKALVQGGDALSSQFVTGQKSINLTEEYSESINTLLDFVEDDKTNIIMFENPPYRDATSNTHLSSSGKGRNIIKEEMAAERSWGATQNDMANQFIYSAWKHYLAKPNDAFVLFSPVKYWKSLRLGEHKFIDGYLFNRLHFHAGPSAISCILWLNEPDSTEELNLKAFDINTKGTPEQKDDEIVYIKDVKIKKVHESLKPYFDKRKFDDDIAGSIVVELSGYESSKKFSKTPILNDNIVGHIRITSYNLDPISMSLTRIITQNGLMKTIGFYLREDNYIEKLPLFAAKVYPQRNWYERDIYFTTADGGTEYVKDDDFLKACFIFVCLSQRNHCISFTGTDGRFYKNKLCFDKDTLASAQLGKYTLSGQEAGLLKTFNKVLRQAKEMKNYNPEHSYGPYQINKELNTFKYDEVSNIKDYDNPQLNSDLVLLKNELSKYYEAVIEPNLFKYQLLK